jgi:tripartite-type tricarboxylate transporter receptor subunit TctC
MAALALEQKTGVKWVYVPTKGGQASILTLATGEGDFLFMGMLQTLPHVRSGRIRAIAVSSEKRQASLPNVPTVQETPGLKGFVTGSYQGIVGPAKISPAIVTRLNTEIKHIQDMQDIREKLLSQSTTPLPMTPQELSDWISTQRNRWAAVVKASGFKLQ